MQGKVEICGVNTARLKTLTHEEMDTLLRLSKAGDKKAREKLLEHNLRLVVYIAKRFENTGAGLEDLVSIGSIGLVKAVDTFKTDSGTRFATYGARCIQNEILMHFRATKKTERDLSLSDPIDSDSEGHPLTLMDVLAQEDTILPEETANEE